MNRNLMRPLLPVLAASTLLLGLSACAPLVVGGAVATAVVATDRRTAASQLEDESIELKVGSAVRQNMGDRVHVNVTSFNRRVLLTGEVTTAQEKATVERLARSQDNVREVVNDLGLGPASSLTNRSKDLVITSRMRAALIDAKDLQLNAFGVTTERGVIYLMGRVTEREAKRATEIATSISGVAKVVRVFEIISEEELRRLSPPPGQTVKSATPAPAATPAR